MIDLKKLNGIMNLDTPNEDFPPGQHKYLLNGRFRGERGNLRLESIPGNIHIPNAYLPSGINQQNGGFYDSVKRRIIWFNYNSNGKNGIYKYDIGTKTLSKIFICFTDSATDILGLDLNYPIHSATIIYRTDGDGDLLYWTNGLVRPKYINIDTVSAIAPFTDDMISAAKLPPLSPPSVVYGNDSQVNYNKLSSKGWRFYYRWGYKNLEKSTGSPISILSLPDATYPPEDQTKNNYIAVSVTGGGDDYQTIEIFGQSNGINDTTGLNEWTDPFFITSLDRDDYNINPGASYTFRFYNDGVYTSADLIEFLNYYDRVPNVCQTLDSLAGNHIMYANTTDGYDPMAREDVDVIIGSGANGVGFAYSSTHSFVVFITSQQIGVTFNIQFSYNSGAGGDSSPKNVSYVVIGGDTVATIATALMALLSGNNISCTSIGVGVFSVQTTTGAGTITGVIATAPGVTTSPYPITVIGTWDFGINQRMALVYFDKYGKPVDIISFTSDSAIDSTDFSTTTPNFSIIAAGVINIPSSPFVWGVINHTPPENAVSYQVLRASVTPPPLYMVTNDYQTDTDYIYVCIQNLYYQGTKSTGFIPTYSFGKGDRCKIIGGATISGSSISFDSPYSTQFDYEILGVVQRTMTSPAINGTFLKIKKPSSFPSPAYKANMLIKLYTPLPKLELKDQVFYEFGQKWDIYTLGGIRYHRGQIDQTASNPAQFAWYDGDMFFVVRNFYLDVNATTTVNNFFISPRFNEYFESFINSNGRGWALDPNAKQVTNIVEYRWSEGYLQDTNINGLNRVFSTNIDALDLSKGAILRILAEKRLAYFYHSRGVGSVGIYGRYIKNNEGQDELIATNEIITKNNIYYLKGNYGLQNQPCAVFRGEDEVHYFIDCTSGDQLRRSGDGITNLGSIYYGQYAISNLLTPYNSTYLRPDGSKAKIMGYFDYFEGEAHFILQGGSYSGKSIPNYNLSFREGGEGETGYRGFFEDYPEWALQAASETYTWKNGKMYVQNDEVNRGVLYGEKNYPKITLVFNDKSEFNKVFNTLGYQSEGKIWECSKDLTLNGSVIEEAILTSYVDRQTGFRQSSRLKEFNFEWNNGKTTAALLRDINSKKDRREGLWEGNFLEGFWIEIEFEYKNNDLATLYSPYLNYEISNRNF